VLLTCSNHQDLLNSTKIKNADIVLMEISSCKVKGVSQIKRVLPDLDIILTAIAEDHEMAFQALQAGAVGIISKGISPKTLITTLEIINTGGSPITPYIARKICEIFVNNTPDPKNRLTEKEWSILKRFMAGSSYADIAEKMFSSSAKIHQTVRQIYQKLHNHPDSRKLRKK